MAEGALAADWEWQSPLPTTEKLWDVWASGREDYFAVGHAGTIAHFDGNTWSLMESGTTKNLFGVGGTGPDNVYAVGEEGAILHYDGSGWEACPSETFKCLHSVWGDGTSTREEETPRGNRLSQDPMKTPLMHI